MSQQINAWGKDPVKFVRDVFSIDPDPWQVEVLREFPKRNRIAMKASKGCGKSAVLAMLAWNFIATRPEAKIAVTSITADNLADGLWSEMAKWYARAPFLKRMFTFTKTRVFAKESPDNWFISARTWPKSADSSQQADTLAGLHADYLLFILDEAGGIPDAVMAAAEAGLATGIETKIIMAGNPTHLEGPLYRACTNERHMWWVAEITGDPDNPQRASRISVQWARDQIEKYGLDNPWVLVNVFGRFPPSSLNTILGPDEVRASMNRYVKEEDYSFSQKRLGIDVSRFGDDRTVIFPRQGLVAFKPDEMRGLRSNEIAARVAKAKATWCSDVEAVDGSGGWGSGVIDSLVQAGHAPLEISFSGRAIDPRYFNKRSEMWFLMAEWVKKGGSLPNMPDLVRELTTPTYTFHNGKFRLEEKDQIKARLGYSPDLADALALTFCMPEMPREVGFLSPGSAHVKKSDYDYDPFSSDRH